MAAVVAHDPVGRSRDAPKSLGWTGIVPSSCVQRLRQGLVGRTTANCGTTAFGKVGGPGKGATYPFADGWMKLDDARVTVPHCGLARPDEAALRLSLDLLANVRPWLKPSGGERDAAEGEG